jgi:hypothetical protein
MLAVALPSLGASGCPYALAGYGAGADEAAGAPADEGTCGALIGFPHWGHMVDPSAILAPQFGQNISGLAECEIGIWQPKLSDVPQKSN